jgi:hypothetical protein
MRREQNRRHKSYTTKDNVRKQCATSRKTDERDMNAQDHTLLSVTAARFPLGRSSCGAQVVNPKATAKGITRGRLLDQFVARRGKRTSRQTGGVTVLRLAQKRRSQPEGPIAADTEKSPRDPSDQ